MSSPGQALQHQPRPPLPFIQQQTTALLTQAELVALARCYILIHVGISDVCRVRKNPDEVEADPGLEIVTLSGVRHFTSAQTVISVISGSLPHFSLNPARVFRPSHTPICLHIIDTVWPALARPNTELCKSVIELGLTSQDHRARAKACQSCLPGHSNNFLD